MPNETDDDLNKQIAFKMEYDRIMREAELREKGGLRPRATTPGSTQTYPSRLMTTLMRGCHIRV